MAFLYVLIFLGWLALPPALAAIGLGLASIVEGRSRPAGGWSRVRIAGGAAGAAAGAVAMGAVILPWAVLCLFMLLLATRPGGLWPGGW